MMKLENLSITYPQAGQKYLTDMARVIVYMNTPATAVQKQTMFVPLDDPVKLSAHPEK